MPKSSSGVKPPKNKQVVKNVGEPSTQPENTPIFMFPKANSKIIPNPSKFFSSTLLSSPLPTTSFFTNFVIGDGHQPAFIHPYLIKLSQSSLSISYPSISSSSSSISQTFFPDFTISTSHPSSHLVTSFSDLTVTVDFPSSDFRFLLARGSPYVTLQVLTDLQLFFSTGSEIESIPTRKSNNNTHKIKLKNKQIWVVYASSELSLKQKDNTHITSSKPFSGVVRIAVVPEENCAKSGETLDLYSTCYAISGEAEISAPFSMEYKWETEGWGELLMLAHPLHLNLLSVYYSGVKVVDNFKYKSIDGYLVGVIGNKWKLRVDYVPISWHSRRGISGGDSSEIVNALRQDVGALESTPITTTRKDIYRCAKIVSKAARLALIAEELKSTSDEIVPIIQYLIVPIIQYLKVMIGRWLDGSDSKHGFFHDEIWGGVVSRRTSTDVTADCGFGLYNNHHVILGYFVFSIAVLAKIDPESREKYKGKAYALVGSYMSMKKREKPKYTKLRCFDVYKLHSWTKHLGDDKERNSDNPSASIHAYYAAALLGMVYEDDHLVNVGSMLTSFEMEAVKTWWHVKEGGVYEGDEFLKNNKMVGTVCECTRQETLCLNSAPENRVYRVGSQVKPLMPVLSEMLFSDVGFVRDVVEWARPALATGEAADNWKGLVYALEAIFDSKNALKMIRNLKGFVEENSMSNMLWWAHGWRKDWCLWCRKDAKECGYCAYC